MIPEGWVLRPRCRHESADCDPDDALVRAYQAEHERLTGIRLGRRWAEQAVRTGWRPEHLARVWGLAVHSVDVGAPVVVGADVDVLDRFAFLRRCGTWLHRELDIPGQEALPWLAVVASTTDPDLLTDLVEAVRVGAAWLGDRQLAGGRRAAWAWAAGLPAATSADQLAAEPDDALVSRAAARGIRLPPAE